MNNNLVINVETWQIIFFHTFNHGAQRHTPTSVNYLHGQSHYMKLDDMNKDREANPLDQSGILK